MRISIILVLLLVAAILIDNGECGRRRRRSWKKVKNAAVSVAIQHGIKIGLGALGRKRRSIDDVSLKTSQQIDHFQPSDVQISAIGEEPSSPSQKQAAQISGGSKVPPKPAELGSNDNGKELHNHDYNDDNYDDDTASYFHEQSTSNGELPIPFGTLEANDDPIILPVMATEAGSDTHKTDQSDTSNADLPDTSNDDQPDRDDNCEDCLEIRPFKVSEQSNQNKTMSSNDFVLVVKFIEENISALKMKAKIKFEVSEVIKSPLKNVKRGDSFTIRADMAKCSCLTSLNPGHYVVTGSVDENHRLVLSNVLMEFEN